MNYEEFNNWLINEKGLAKKSARDVKSRCKRVERIFDISLDEVCEKNEIDKIIARLQNEANSYLNPETNKTFAVGVLVTAVKHYDEFYQLNQS